MFKTQFRNKNKISYMEGVPLKEVKETFLAAQNICNILIELVINDYLLSFTDEGYIFEAIFDGSYTYTSRMSEDVFDILRIVFDRKDEFYGRKNEDYFSSLIKNKNINTHHSSLLDTFMTTLSDFDSICYENSKSKIQFPLKKDLEIRWYFNETEKKYIVKNAPVEIKDSMSFLTMDEMEDKVSLCLAHQKMEKIFLGDWKKKYKKLKKLVNTYSYLLPNLNVEDYEKNKVIKEKIKLMNDDFFKDGKVRTQFLNPNIISLYDLSQINFDGKNISGIDISRNPEVKINLDKIVKDISNCNFRGYDLSYKVLKDFNLKETDLRQTNVGVDFLSCNLSIEGKMCTGTLLDENNKFFFGNRKLTCEEVEDLGIKVYRKR